MATYYFECEKCNKTQEREIAMKDYDKEKNNQYCVCGHQMKRVFKPIGLTIYNATGFYDTDNRGIRGR